MSKNLILSHWNDTKEVFVPEDVAETLSNYQIMGVRFLYDCFQKKLPGAVLNEVDGMNVEIQVASFFNALNFEITAECPLLIICSPEAVAVWHYHLTHHGQFNVILVSANNFPDFLDEDDNNDCVFIATSKDVTLLREIKQFSFFSIVIDELDKMVKKNHIKQLKSHFNIGITRRNFLKQPEQKLYWYMINWSNPGGKLKFADFCFEDDYRLKNLQDPYPSWWFRLTWKFCESFKPKSLKEEQEYKATLQKWSQQNRLKAILEAPASGKKRKRKSIECLNGKNSETFISKCSYDIFNESQLVPNVENIEGNNESQETIIYNLNVDEDIKMEVEQKDDLLSMLYGDTTAIGTSKDAKTSAPIGKDYTETQSGTDPNSEVLSFLFD